jgi:hypothetical protein
MSMLNARRWSASAAGRRLAGEERTLARVTVVDLFAHKEVRLGVILAFLMLLATTLGYWGVGAWVPSYVAAAAAKASLDGQQWAGYAGITNAGPQ